ncbi:MAG: carboxypeptidase-like regulatory domain-containing protein [Candidatus Aminicenantales bacterium]
MFKWKSGRVQFLVFLLVTLAVSLTAGPALAQTVERGHLVGTIFTQDGKTPMVGAIVRLKNITSGAISVALPTDTQGYFRMENLSKGIYQFGITTAQGDFNSNELVGILANETTRISLALNPYETGVQSAVQEVLRDQSVAEGESRIGRVIRYNASTKEAEVFIEKGVLQIDDRVRVKGIETNFFQDVDSLGAGGEIVKRLFAGQNGLMKMEKNTDTGDGIYVVCKKGVPPFFLTPCGIASVIAGSGLILAGVVEVTDKTPVSPFKK